MSTSSSSKLALSVRPPRAFDPASAVFNAHKPGTPGLRIQSALSSSIADAAKSAVQSHSIMTAANAGSFAKPAKGANAKVHITKVNDFSASSKFAKTYSEGNIKLEAKLLRVTKPGKTASGHSLSNSTGLALTTNVNLWWKPEVLTMGDSLFRDVQYVLAYLDKQHGAIKTAAKQDPSYEYGSQTPEMLKIWPLMSAANLSEYAREHYLPKCQPANTPSYSPNSPMYKGTDPKKSGYVPMITDLEQFSKLVTDALKNRRVADLTALIMFTVGQAKTGGSKPRKGNRKQLQYTLLPYLDTFEFTHPRPVPPQTAIKEHSIVELCGIEYKVTIDPMAVKIAEDGRMELLTKPRYEVQSYKLLYIVDPMVLMKMRLSKKNYAQMLQPADALLAAFRQSHPLEAAELIAAMDEPEDGQGDDDGDAPSAVGPSTGVAKKKKNEFILKESMLFVPSGSVSEYYDCDSVLAISFGIPVITDKENPWLTKSTKDQVLPKIRAKLILQGEQRNKALVEVVASSNDDDNVTALNPDELSQVPAEEDTSSREYRVYLNRMVRMVGVVDIFSNKGLEVFPLHETDAVNWVTLAPLWWRRAIGIIDVGISPLAESDIIYNANQMMRSMSDEEALFKAHHLKHDLETGEEYLTAKGQEELVTAVSIATIAPTTMGYNCRASGLLIDLPVLIRSCGVHVSQAVVKTFLATQPARPKCTNLEREGSGGVINLSQTTAQKLPDAAAYDFYLIYPNITDSELQIMQTITPEASDVLYADKFLKSQNKSGIVKDLELQDDILQVVGFIKAALAYAFAVPKGSDQRAEELYAKLCSEYPDAPVKQPQETPAATAPSSPVRSTDTASRFEEIPDEDTEASSNKHATNGKRKREEAKEEAKEGEDKPETTERFLTPMPPSAPKRVKLDMDDDDDDTTAEAADRELNASQFSGF